MNDRTCSPCGGEVAVATAEKAKGAFRPRIEIVSQPEGEVLRAELPGVKRESVEIRLEGEHLWLGAAVDAEPAGRSYLVRESERGSFERRFRLGAELDTSAITAEWADGVLTLKLPRKAEAQPRRIEISQR
jgi:HSP20 family molecular chaperone IbpA